MTMPREAIGADTASRVSRSIDSAGRFTLAFFEDPAMLEDFPDGTTLVLLPDDDPDLAESNLQSDIQLVRAGQDGAFRHMRTPERIG